jgi:hypothetical protein
VIERGAVPNPDMRDRPLAILLFSVCELPRSSLACSVHGQRCHDFDQVCCNAMSCDHGKCVNGMDALSVPTSLDDARAQFAAAAEKDPRIKSLITVFKFVGVVALICVAQFVRIRIKGYLILRDLREAKRKEAAMERVPLSDDQAVTSAKDKPTRREAGKVTSSSKGRSCNKESVRSSSQGGSKSAHSGSSSTLSRDEPSRPPRSSSGDRSSSKHPGKVRSSRSKK